MHTHRHARTNLVMKQLQSALLFTQPWSTQCSLTPLISGSPPSLETVLWWLITCFDLGLFHLHDISRTVIVLNIHRACHLLQSPSSADLHRLSSFRYSGCLDVRLMVVFEKFLSFKNAAGDAECYEMHHIHQTVLRWQSWQQYERISSVYTQKIKFTRAKSIP